jgi:signal transduction histidine kinase
LSGEVREVVIIHNDVTRIYESLEEKIKLTEDLIHERNRLENFISIASHELKTPLTSLSLQMEIIRRILKSPHDQIDVEGLLKFSSSSLNQLTRLTRLIDEMLDITRIKAGKLDIVLRKTDLKALTLEVISRFNDQFTDLGISVVIHDMERVLVNCDPYRMEQVLTNVISNSIRYGLRRPVEFQLKRVGEKAQLIIRDHGRGIARENHGKIFERFERAEPQLGMSGLGLGLFISKEIMEEFKGEIYVESDLGRGARFFIELRACEEE